MNKMFKPDEQLRPEDDMATGGVKADHGKARMDLLPPELMEAVATILTYGAAKYSDRNWEKGMAWSRPYGALLRHLFSWWSGENKDKDTGYSHLWHAGCNIAFLIAFESRGTGKDDRPSRLVPMADSQQRRAYAPELVPGGVVGGGQANGMVNQKPFP